MFDKTRKVKDIEDLKKLTYKAKAPFFIARNRELISSKEIYWSGKKYFYVTNLIDDSNEKLTIEELENSYIGKALRAGCLFWEDTNPNCFI